MTLLSLVWFTNTETSQSPSPEFGAAVRAAEAGAVVHVLIGHQPLQRIHRLQARRTRLLHRQAEVLCTASKHSVTLRGHVTYYVM